MTDDEKDKEAEAIIDKLRYTDKEKLEKFMADLQNTISTLIREENNKENIEKTRDEFIEKYKDMGK